MSSLPTPRSALYASLTLLVISAGALHAQINSTNITGVGNTLQATASSAALISASASTNGGTNSAIIGAANSLIPGATRFAFIGAGNYNVIAAGSHSAGMIAGFSNTISTGGVRGATLGGAFNTNAGRSAVILGGELNQIAVNSTGAVVLGGLGNTASAPGATVPGGAENWAAGSNSFAAGSYAVASNTGTFVWADMSTSSDFISTANNQFLVRATGGVGINTNITGSNALLVNGAAQITGQLSVGTLVGGTFNSSRAGGFVGGGVANVIGTNAFVSGIVSGNANTITGGQNAFIGGGRDNLVQALGTNPAPWNAAILGGYGNRVNTGDNSTIAGGRSNSMFGHDSLIGAGYLNSVGPAVYKSALVSGDNNSLQAAERSFLGGGGDNSIQGGTNVAYATVLVGGSLNSVVQNYYGALVGGYSNYLALSDAGFVGAGRHNYLFAATNGVIAGGDRNTNTFSQDAAVVAGERNLVDVGGNWAFIGAGFENRVAGQASAVVGGSSQTNVGTYSFIGGGRLNNINGIEFAFIGGGEQNFLGGSYSAIGGGYSNFISTNYAFIGGGRFNTNTSSVYGTIGGGTGNKVSGSSATIAGGANNAAMTNFAAVGGGFNNTNAGFNSTIAGGANNTISSGSVQSAAIGGGENNSVTTNYSAIAGGRVNTNQLADSFIGGGRANSILNTNGTNDGYAAIAGGYSNQITSGGTYSFIGGGSGNFASGGLSVVAGGRANRAAGAHSTVAGGQDNLAGGALSFAAGRNAKATNNHSFVWGGCNLAAVTTTSTNTESFTVRAPGGVRFITTTNATFAATNNGVILQPGGNSWAALSDSNAKTAIKAIDTRAILRKLAALPVTEWQYKGQPDRQYIGPMAQDFHAAFGLGYDDKTISTADSDGVMYAAIQGLVEELKEQDAQMAAQETVIGELKARNDEMQSELRAIRDQLSNLPPGVRGRQ